MTKERINELIKTRELCGFWNYSDKRDYSEGWLLPNSEHNDPLYPYKSNIDEVWTNCEPLGLFPFGKPEEKQEKTQARKWLEEGRKIKLKNWPQDWFIQKINGEVLDEHECNYNAGKGTKDYNGHDVDDPKEEWEIYQEPKVGQAEKWYYAGERICMASWKPEDWIKKYKDRRWINYEGVTGYLSSLDFSAEGWQLWKCPAPVKSDWVICFNRFDKVCEDLNVRRYKSGIEEIFRFVIRLRGNEELLYDHETAETWPEWAKLSVGLEV